MNKSRKMYREPSSVTILLTKSQRLQKKKKMHSLSKEIENFFRIKQNSTYFKNRTDLIELLGGYNCQCLGSDCWHSGKCKINDKRLIQIDHKNGGGNKERSKINAKGSYRYYLNRPWEAKEKLQILCANCNWIKRYNKSEIFIKNPSDRRSQ